jgi:hypothetical protein
VTVGGRRWASGVSGRIAGGALRIIQISCSVRRGPAILPLDSQYDWHSWAATLRTFCNLCEECFAPPENCALRLKQTRLLGFSMSFSLTAEMTVLSGVVHLQ